MLAITEETLFECPVNLISNFRSRILYALLVQPPDALFRNAASRVKIMV